MSEVLVYTNRALDTPVHMFLLIDILKRYWNSLDPRNLHNMWFVAEPNLGALRCPSGERTGLIRKYALRNHFYG